MLEQTHCREEGGRQRKEGGRESSAANRSRANASTDVAATGGGMVDDAAPLSMKTEGVRDGGLLPWKLRCDAQGGTEL